MNYTLIHAIKVDINPFVYCLIVAPNNDRKRDFYIAHSEEGDPIYMFSCEVKSDDEAVDLAASNAPDYMPPDWVDTWNE